MGKAREIEQIDHGLQTLYQSAAVLLYYFFLFI